MGAVCGSSAANQVVAPRSGKPVSVRVLEAAAAGDLERLRGLVERGASVQSADHAGRSALHLACAEGRLQVVEYLLSKGAKLDVKDRWGNEPIQEAIIGGYKEVVQMMTTAGAHLSDESKAQMEIRLFHFAAMGNVHGVEDLLQQGTWINASDYLGKTALHIAAERGNAEVVRFLLNHGADRDCVDLQGDTPLNLAMEQEQFEVQNILREAGATPRSVKVETPPTPKKRPRRASFTVMEAFPMPIAQAMLDGRKIEPITKPSVSLFYSDIVGFTTISSTIDASTVSRMLNSLFRKFDRLAYVHGVQKVDVIGDAYIAATNFTEDQSEDHAARLARFAIDAIAAARDTPIDEDDPEGHGSVEIRIGMHCGPVSGTVIGTNVIKYTLMGEAVHIASKMESSSLPGRIQCSEASAALIAQQANDVEVIRRDGPGVAVQGSKGALVPTYWVSSVRERTGRFHSCPDLSDLSRVSSAASHGSHASFDLDMGDWFHRAGSGGAGDSFKRAGSGGATAAALMRGKDGPAAAAAAPLLLRGKDGPVGCVAAAPLGPGALEACSADRRRPRRNSTACNGPSLICRL